MFGVAVASIVVALGYLRDFSDNDGSCIGCCLQQAGIIITVVLFEINYSFGTYPFELVTIVPLFVSRSLPDQIMPTQVIGRMETLLCLRDETWFPICLQSVP